MSIPDDITDDIKRLAAIGSLWPCKTPLRGKQQPCRLLYFECTAAERARELLKTAQTDGFTDGAASPRDQFMSLSRRYCAGDPFDDPQPHPMSPTSDGVWRLRTPDLRIIGWFPARCIFIISEVELKMNCDNIRDEQLLAEARATRISLAIGGGTFLKGPLHDCI